MSENTAVSQDPNGLLDALSGKHNLRNDAALARFMKVAPPVISKLRGYKLAVGDSFVMRCLELADMTLTEVRAFVPSPYVGAA